MASRPPPPPPPRRATTGTHRVQREPDSGVRAVGQARQVGQAGQLTREFEHFVRINPQGEVVAAHGSAQRIAALSSYVCALADAAGELLEIGPCRVMEASYAGGKLIVLREPDGSIVGLKPLAANPAQAARAGVGR